MPRTVKTASSQSAPIQQDSITGTPKKRRVAENMNVADCAKASPQTPVISSGPSSTSPETYALREFIARGVRTPDRRMKLIKALLVAGLCLEDIMLMSNEDVEALKIPDTSDVAARQMKKSLIGLLIKQRNGDFNINGDQAGNYRSAKSLTFGTLLPQGREDGAAKQSHFVGTNLCNCTAILDTITIFMYFTCRSNGNCQQRKY